MYQDTNVGISYEYSVPKSIHPNTENETYAWTFNEFSPCTATCGGGVQYRNVTCAGRKTLEPVDRTLCDASNEPPATQRCGEIPCEPRWVIHPWENCSAPCGQGGYQTRRIQCEQVRVAPRVGRQIKNRNYCVVLGQFVVQKIREIHFTGHRERVPHRSGRERVR